MTSMIMGKPLDGLKTPPRESLRSSESGEDLKTANSIGLGYGYGFGYPYGYYGAGYGLGYGLGYGYSYPYGYYGGYGYPFYY